MEFLELPLEELVNHLMWVRGTHSIAPVIRKHSEVPSPLPTTHWRRHEQWTPALSRSALARTVDSHGFALFCLFLYGVCVVTTLISFVSVKDFGWFVYLSTRLEGSISYREVVYPVFSF